MGRRRIRVTIGRSCYTCYPGRRGVSLFANFAQLSLLVVMVGLAALSGMVMSRSIQEEDAVIAWMGAAALVATSLLTDLLFWSVV